MRSSAGYLSRISCSAVLLAVLAMPVQGAILSGTVTHRTGGSTRPEGVSAALVSVYNTSTRSKSVTRTNTFGLYAFRNLPAGSYVILVEKDGRRIYQGKVEVRAQETHFDIGL